MSDCFDHGLEAFEQHTQMVMDGNCDYSTGRSYNINSLHYHNQFIGTTILKTTDKAYLIEFKSGEQCWVAKRLCKRVTDNSIYIWCKAVLKPVNKDLDNITESYEFTTKHKIKI